MEGSGGSSSALQCSGIAVHVALYSSLFAVLLLQVLVVINEVVIFIVSSQGSVWNDKPRRSIPKLLYVRIALFLVEVATLIFTSWAVLYSEKLAVQEMCPPYITAVRFSIAIVAVIWFTLLLYGVGFLLYIGPACCFNSRKDLPSFLQDIDLDDLEPQESDRHAVAKKHWKRLYHGHVEQRRILRRLNKGRSLLCIRNSPHTTAALDDLAYSMHRLFRNVDLVPSDLFAGLLILHRDQVKKIKERGDTTGLTIPLRQVYNI